MRLSRHKEEPHSMDRWGSACACALLETECCCDTGMLLENDIAAVSVLVDDPLALYGYLTEAMLVLNKHEECAAASSRPPRQSAERAPLVCGGDWQALATQGDLS